MAIKFFGIPVSMARYVLAFCLKSARYFGLSGFAVGNFMVKGLRCKPLKAVRDLGLLRSIQQINLKALYGDLSKSRDPVGPFMLLTLR